MSTKPAIKWIPSPHFGYPAGTHGRGGQEPVAIVHHIMEGTQMGTDTWFMSPKSLASTTFSIGITGEIHQYVALGDAAWGNGRLQNPNLAIPWIKRCVEEGINPNLLTVSVEYEGRHPTDEKGNRIGFYEFTEAQVLAGIALDAWLCELFTITPSRDTIVGHCDVDAVDRPYCPGPNFPFARVIAALQPPITNWSPQAEVDRLLKRGIITTPREADAPVKWWELATVANRILDHIEPK